MVALYLECGASAISMFVGFFPINLHIYFLRLNSNLQLNFLLFTINEINKKSQPQISKKLPNQGLHRIE